MRSARHLASAECRWLPPPRLAALTFGHVGEMLAAVVGHWVGQHESGQRHLEAPVLGFVGFVGFAVWLLEVGTGVVVRLGEEDHL